MILLNRFQPHLIDPQFSYNDVVHCGVNFLPCVVIAALFKDCMNCPCTERGNTDIVKKKKSAWTKQIFFFQQPLNNNLLLSQGESNTFFKICSLISQHSQQSFSMCTPLIFSIQEITTVFSTTPYTYILGLQSMLNFLDQTVSYLRALWRDIFLWTCLQQWFPVSGSSRDQKSHDALLQGGGDLPGKEARTKWAIQFDGHMHSYI